MSKVERKKKRRHNYQAEVERLVLYCQVSIEVIDSDGLGPVTDYAKGKREAFRAVLSRLGRNEVVSITDLAS